MQAQGDVGIFGRVGTGLVQKDLVEGQLLGTFACNVLERNGGMPKVLLRQAVHVVPRAGRVEHVRFEHGVIGHPLHLDRGRTIGKDVDVVLGVLAYLGFCRVLQQGLEREQNGLTVQLGRGAFVVVHQGDVGRFMGLDGEGNPYQLGALRIEAGGFGIEREQRCLAQLLEPGVEAVLVKDGFIAGLDHGRRGFYRGQLVPFPSRIALQVGNPALELHFGIQRQQRLAVWFAAHQRIDFDVQRHIDLDGGQLVRHESRFTVFFKLGGQALGASNGQRRHLVQVRVQVAEPPADPGQQPDGGLFTHTWHTWNVVHLVAHQRQEVDDVLGADPEFLVHASHVQHATGHGVDQGNVPVDQLRHVLVAGGNDDRPVQRRAAACQGTDDIVSFDPFDAQQWVAHGLDAGMQRLDLHPQIVRHAGAVGLVVGEQGVAERAALGVEHHSEQAVRVLPAQALEHVEHTLHRTGWHALGRGQRWQGMEGAIKVGGTVHEDEGRLAHEQNQPFRRVRR